MTVRCFYSCIFSCHFLSQIEVLLSDLGGAVGFYMGLSVIACFELLELMIDLIRLSIVKLAKPKQSKGIKSVTVHPNKDTMF